MCGWFMIIATDSLKKSPFSSSIFDQMVSAIRLILSCIGSSLSWACLSSTGQPLGSLQIHLIDLSCTFWRLFIWALLQELSGTIG